MTKSESNSAAPAAAAPTPRRPRPPTVHEWIGDYFSPVVTVLASADAEAVAAKNNLTLTELLQPFSKLLTDVTVKDAEGAVHPISALNVNFLDFRKDPTRLVNQRLMSDLLAECTDEPMVTRSFSGASSGVTLSAPGYTPWFDAWTQLYIHSVPTADHEYVRHHLGAIFAVSTSHKNPLQALRSLSEQQHRHQHERPTAYPQYATTHVLKYYVLVHDVYDADDATAQEMFTQMQNAFGSSSCHLLQINSSKESSASVSDLTNHWLGPSRRFCNVEARREGIGATLITTSTTAELNNSSSINNSKAATTTTPAVANNSSQQPQVDHPLAAALFEDGEGSKEGGQRSPTPPTPLTNSNPAAKLQPVTAKNIAARLTSNDIDRIRILVREFVIKSLIPHIERQLRMLHEIVTNRKSRSLFSGAKRWFGQQNKSGGGGGSGVGGGGTGGGGGGGGPLGGTSVVYGKEAPELHMRKLADFYFMLKMYKSAYHYYHAVKKDFQSDEAWNYYAGAAEMSALAQFMQNDPTAKKYPAHYIEDSITKYLHVCQMPEFAVRATLFDAMCLKFLGMFQEAAVSYIRLTNESKDLRSSLLLEQASYCFLLSNPPMLRKYAFHIILSGYRFSKSGQKKHSSRAYRQGFQIYRGLGWSLAEDHILYTLGHQSLLLKDHRQACSLFNDLLLRVKPHGNVSPLQQMCHLREFFIVQHLREKEVGVGGGDDVVTIPRFTSQKAVLDLSDGDADYAALQSLNPRDSWLNLERVMLENVRGREVLFLSKSCQDVFTVVSSNSLMPQAAVGERIRLVVPVSNDFQTTLLMKNTKLLWKFSSDDQSDLVSNERVSDEEEAELSKKFVNTEAVDLVTLDKSSTVNVALSVTLLEPGELTIVGVAYGLQAQFPQTEATDYTIRGRQHFEIKGPRLTSTKDQKTSVVYGIDNRLRATARAGRPKLSFNLEGLPDELRASGEMRCVELVLTNDSPSKVDIDKVLLVSETLGFISFGKQSGRNSDKATALFEFPVIDDDALSKVADNGLETRKKLDMHTVPLAAPLTAGNSVRLPLWLRCPPGSSGQNSVRLHVFYQKGDGDNYRIASRDFSFKIVPLVTASAVWNEVCVYDDRLRGTKNVVVHLSNVGKGGDGVEISQVSLVSHRDRLSKLDSLNDKGVVVQVSDSAAIGLKAITAVAAADKEDRRRNQDEFGVNFSSVNCRNVQGHDVQLAPYLDFLKPGFVFEAKEPPRLRDDLLVVFWKCQQLSGVLISPLRSVPSTEIDVTDSSGATSSPSTTAVGDRRTKTPCKAELALETSSSIQHDFSTSPFLTVPCKLTVTNSGQKSALFSLQTELLQELSLLILGAVDMSRVELSSGETRVIQFRLAVAAPGVYRVRGLKLQMEPIPHDSTAAAAPNPLSFGAIPLETSFVVTPVGQAD